MSNFQRWVIATIAAILGAQLPGLITTPTPALSEGECAYRWGDLNRAAANAGSAVYREIHGYGPLYRSATSHYESNNADSETADQAPAAAVSPDGYADAAEAWGAN